MGVRRYIQLDSTYRNRNIYPNPSQFVVPLNSSSMGGDNAFTSVDTVINAYPQFTFTGNSLARGPEVFNGGTNINPILNPAALIEEDVYNGYQITDTTIGQTRTIIDYDGSSQMVTLDHPFLNTWLTTDTYTIQDSSLSSNIMMQNNASSIADFYVGKVIYNETTGEYRIITDYDNNLRTAILDSPFGGSWSLTDTYSIRQSAPSETGSLVNATNSSFTLPGTSSSLDNFYNGTYMYITSGPAINNLRLISSYTGLTRTGQVSSPFSATPLAGDTYQILLYSYDSFHPLDYTSSFQQQQEACYEIEMLMLSLPNMIVTTDGGRRITDYPYVFVEFSNESSPNMRVIYSNNPHAMRALFIAPMHDTTPPTVTAFIILDSKKMIQTVKFKLSDSLRFSVTLPNGELVLFEPDNIFPLPPNPDLQISAVFSIKQVI